VRGRRKRLWKEKRRSTRKKNGHGTREWERDKERRRKEMRIRKRDVKSKRDRFGDGEAKRVARRKRNGGSTVCVAFN
jgi:YD repeat-containing protein